MLGGLRAFVSPVSGPFSLQRSCSGPALTATGIDTVPRRDRIMVPLLNACVKKLQEQGMRKMFLDGVVNHLESFKQLGKASGEQLDIFRTDFRLYRF
jgi:hypothetical protein